MSPYFSTRKIIACASCLWIVINLCCMKLYVDTVNQCVEIIKSRSVKSNHSQAWLSARTRHRELGTYSSEYYGSYEPSSKETSLAVKGVFDLEILVFSTIGGGFSKGFEVSHTCQDDKIFVCYAEGDISEVTSDYDVIIFAGDILNDRVWDFLTQKRDPRQVWLFFSNVSPMKSMYIMPPPELSSARFNMSFTHHSMSELSYFYGEFYRFTEERTAANETRNPFEEYTNRKLIAWDSVDCANVSWDRSGFVNDLSKYLPIDSYGDCGNLTCRNLNNKRKTPGSGGCRNVLKEYKFVLALEDGCCSELVSDHFWNVLSYYKSVPVVVGPSKADYKRVAPPDSFIFAGDFSTIKDLAAYIREVASTPEMYGAFFKWQNLGVVNLVSRREREISHKASLCRVTDYLHNRFSRKNARNRKFHSRVEPYGPFWRGGCNQCRNYDVLKKYER